MPDANDTNESGYLERPSGPPIKIPRMPDGDRFRNDDEENITWPMMVYVMPNGMVFARRELVKSEGTPFSATHLAHRAAMVFKVKPEIEPGNSGGGQPFSVEVLKFRGDLGDFFRSVTKSFMSQPAAEEKLLQAIFPGVKLIKEAQDGPM